MQITVTQVAENRRRRKPKSGETLGFGNHFSDHMFLMDYSQGTGWRDARIGCLRGGLRSGDEVQRPERLVERSCVCRARLGAGSRQHQALHLG